MTIYLKKDEITAANCVELFPYGIHREMPLQGYVTDNELERILNVIDTSTEVGSRNRAIIWMATATGLRACDVIRLKLRDIDWRNGEIRLVQSKTKLTVSLQLMRETAAALQDYVLRFRPSGAEYTEVFLRCSAPKLALTDAGSIGTMIKNYERQAGVERKPFDGKGFHGLRRRLAKKLLTSGTPVTTIAQILGHEDVHSTQQYLVLDTKNLKECALDFQGIGVERKALLCVKSLLAGSVITLPT